MSDHGKVQILHLCTHNYRGRRSVDHTSPIVATPWYTHGDLMSRFVTRCP